MIRRWLSGEKRDIALFLAAALAQRLGPMLVLPFLLAGLSLTEYGAFALVLSVVTLLPIVLSLNIPAVVTRLYFDAPPDHRTEHVIRLVSGTAATIVVLSSVAALIAAINLSGVGNLLAVSETDAGWLAVMIILASAGAAFLQLSYGVWRATTRPFRAVVANATASGLMVVIVAWFAARHQLTLLVAAGAIAGAYFSAGVLSLASLDWWHCYRAAVPSRAVIQRAVAKAIPVLGYTLGMWMLTAGGRWIGRYNLTLEDVAQFTVATQISAVLSLLGRCAYETWSPVVYRMHSTGEVRAAQEYLARRARLCVATMLACAIAAMVVAWVFIEHQAAHYSPVMTLLPVVLAAPVVDMAHLRHYTSLMAAKQMNAIAGYTTLSLTLFIALGFAASSQFGVLGLCGAFLVTHLVQWALAAALDRRARASRPELLPAGVPSMQAP